MPAESGNAEQPRYTVAAPLLYAKEKFMKVSVTFGGNIRDLFLYTLSVGSDQGANRPAVRPVAGRNISNRAHSISR